MRQLLLYGFCLFFSTFLTAQKTNNQDVENNLKLNSKVASFFMNKDRKTPSMIKMNPEANLRIENVPGFLTSALQIKSSAFQFTLTDRLVSKNGSETITFSASYNGVNVIHSKYKAFVKDGDVKFISMEHYSFNEKMNKSAVLTKDQARSFATSHVGADVYVWETISNLLSKTVNKKEVLSLEAQYKEVFPVGELVYVDDFMTSESNLKLAYRFNMYASEPIYRANVFIDAQSGKILLEDAIIKHANEINEKRTSLGITAGITYGPTSATVATGNTRYAGIRNFETTLDETSTTARYSLDGTIDLLPYGIVDDPLTTEVNEALVLNETRSLDGVGGIPLGVNGIPSYSIYDGFSRDEEGQLVAEIGDNNWTTEEHYRNDFSIPYPAHKEEKNDDTALDAHWGAEIVIRYWADIHGRSSHNNKGAKVISYVHSGQQFDNAFWNGTAMTYGDGSYQGGSNPNGNFAPLTSLDVCGHEIGHGVCSATSDLVYARESGAMNEGFSDIWAAAVEAYVLRDIDGDLPYDPWGIGEQIDERDGGLAPGEAGSQALRWMDDPNAAGDPSFYGGEDWNEPECGPPSTANDQCGVHSNSGVLNKWYYLLVAGSGKELTLGKDKILADPAKQDRGAGLPYTVEALGFIIADQITFKAEVLLTSNAKFAEMREASILVAGAEYSAYEVEQVTNAWFAVGVGEQYVAPGANILLYENSNVSLTQENTLGDGCNEVNTFTIEVTAASITTPQTAVFTFDESTATLGQDFDISPASLTFPVSTTSLTQAITVTIYNDAVVEGAEVIQMNFTNGSAETDIRKQIITVIDDDYIPAIGVGEIELLNETFDTTDTPTGWFVSSEFDVNTWAFNGVGITSFGRAYVIPAALNPDEPTYNGTADSSIHLLSSPLDARGMTSVNVSFDWTAGGENDGTALFDWGEFMYTLDGVTYESVERFSNAGLPGSGTGPQASGTFEALMPELDGTAFTLIWRWYNDALVQGTYSFSIDNVLVTGLSAPVEGDLTHSDNAIVNQESQVYFISNQDSDVMAVIENASADLGCVSLEVVETGFGGVFPNTIDGAISHAGKIIKITADGENATYDVTLYYTDSELSNIQDPNSLKMMKVNSADIEDASDNSSVNYAVSGALLLENTDRSYRSYKGTFTGNGVIGLVSTSETLAATSFNVSQFNVFPTVINNSEIVHITNSKTFIEKVDIYSINGKLVKSFDFNSKYTVSVPVTKLSSGMYFLNINKDRSNTHKFIVK